jgi:hypothetical protein
MLYPITGINPKASCGVLNPPLRGIVQLTNSALLAELEFHNKKIKGGLKRRYEYDNDASRNSRALSGKHGHYL